VLFASASVIVLGAGGAFAAGGSAAGPSVTPPTTAFIVQHASTSTVVPLNDPALTAVSVPLQR
jgi:hypothetical protein